MYLYRHKWINEQKELIGKNGILTIKELINPKEGNINVRKNKIGGKIERHLNYRYKLKYI